jgi:NADPH-dependent ferric siderophore reductase
VVAAARRSPRLVRLTLGGPELEGLDIGLPASSVRLLVPSPGAEEPEELEIPAWNGNEFLYSDGSRPAIRTVTPLAFSPESTELVVEIVRHGDGPLAQFAEGARPGARAAVSGTGRGYDVDAGARSFLVAGDESAIPAISSLLPALPDEAEVRVLIEVASPDARVELPPHPGVTVEWRELPPGSRPGDALLAGVTSATLDPEVRVWAAGEAAAVQRIRKHLFDERGLGRSQAVVRGYWKHGRAGGPDAG